MRVFVFKFLALFGGTVIALLLAEAFVRVYNPLGQRIYGDQIVLPKNRHQTIRNDENLNLDELIQFSTNSIGFRGPEPPRKFDSSLTMVTIGGSTTECMYLSNGKSWPEVVGRFLAPAFNPLWVNNAGLNGHSSFGHLFLLDQIVGPMRPKVAVFLIGINDVGLSVATRYDVATERPPLTIQLARRSAIVAAVINLKRQGDARESDLRHVQIDLAALPNISADHNFSASLLGMHREQYVLPYKERVETIVRLSREYGIEPVLMTQPALYGVAVDPLTLVNLDSIVVSDERRIKAGRRVRGKLAWDVLELYNDAVRAVGRERDVLVIDAAARLPKSSQLFYDFVHFTNDGASELARIVSEDLCSFLAKRFPDFVAGPCPVIEPVTVGADETFGSEASDPSVIESTTHLGCLLEPAGDGVPGNLFDPRNRGNADTLNSESDDHIESSSSMLETVVGRAFRRRERLSALAAPVPTAFPGPRSVESVVNNASGTDCSIRRTCGIETSAILHFGSALTMRELCLQNSGSNSSTQTG